MNFVYFRHLDIQLLIFAYLCKRMPISLLKHIIKENVTAENFRKIIPSESLVEHIDCFYIVNCEVLISSQLVFNDGLPTLVFMSNAESTVRISVDEDMRDIKGGWVSGGITKNTYIKNLSDTDYLLIVRFNPLSFYHVFEIDIKIFKNKCIGTIQEMLKTKGSELTASVFKANSIDDKISEIESYIMDSQLHCYPIALLNEAIKIIKKQKGKASVIDVSNKVGANYKWLERKFSNHIGLTPKEYANIQRFIHTYLDLTESAEKDYLSIAVQNGYYDQSHLFRDFKSFVGISPLQYLNGSKENNI